MEFLIICKLVSFKVVESKVSIRKEYHKDQHVSYGLTFSNAYQTDTKNKHGNIRVPEFDRSKVRRGCKTRQPISCFHPKIEKKRN
jgi:hypothetical protein